jgi:hypothetical protein
VLLGADVLIGPSSVPFAAEREGKAIEILPLGNGINVLTADMSVL